MEEHFLALMPHTVTIEPVTDHTEHGVPTYGTSVDVRAQVVPSNRRIVARNGVEVIAQGVAYCAGPLVVAEDAVITVPTSFQVATRLPVLRASAYTGPDGIVHNVEVWF